MRNHRLVAALAYAAPAVPLHLAYGTTASTIAATLAAFAAALVICALDRRRPLTWYAIALAAVGVPQLHHFSHHLVLVRCRPGRLFMRTTVTIDDELLERAAELTGITERTALLREGLETLIRIESAKRLAALGGSDPRASAAQRKRSSAQ